MERIFTLGRLASVFFLFQFLIYGADTARLSGTIQDQQGAAIPNAQIVLVNEATGLRRQASTSGTGEYLFLELQIGTYRLEVQASGFRRYVQAGILLSVNHPDHVAIEFRHALLLFDFPG